MPEYKPIPRGIHCNESNGIVTKAKAYLDGLAEKFRKNELTPQPIEDRILGVKQFKNNKYALRIKHSQDFFNGAKDPILQNSKIIYCTFEKEIVGKLKWAVLDNDDEGQWSLQGQGAFRAKIMEAMKNT